MTTPTSRPARADELLHRLTGDPAAEFRVGQREAIERLVDRRGRVLVVQRTGWGKSGVYFIATRLLRDSGAGPTVLVSPLLALMRNQIEAAERAGVRAATINSENRDDWDGIEERVERGDVDLLLISPERLNNPRFRRDVLPRLTSTIGLLVIDEAHCISDWGHDFRPDYRRLARILQLLPAGVPVLCTTATANDRVVNDIVDQLGNELEVVRGPLVRESLSLAAVELAEPARRLAWLAHVIPTLPGTGIVYCLTIADARRVAKWLRTRGIDAQAYSGESEIEDRISIENALLNNEVKVVVATSALGMGFDKPDLSFVIHYQSPGSPIAYYQQVGRAGRQLDHAHGVLLCGREDVEIQDYFIRTAFPPREQAERVIALLETRAAPTSITAIEAEVNARRSRIDNMLKVLEVEGAVERADGGWLRTVDAWSYDEERVEQVTALRRVEQESMVEYAATSGCRMQFLLAELDDHLAEPCGRCDNCNNDVRWTDAPAEVEEAAAEFLRSSVVEIEPRKQWPAGIGEPRGRIPIDVQLASGRALGVFGDGGWGSRVKYARNNLDRYGDELVAAAVTLIRRWSPDPAPRWVACVPSVGEHDRVTAFARELAHALQLPFVAVAKRTRAGQPQREMENSAQQFRNVHGAFALEGAVSDEPVLLVDDTFDSRWTLTAIGVALRNAGSGTVHPFVLAQAVSD
jgi:ATP-dependent DNA helicase RecQ